MPRVSVVIPTYNRSGVIGAAIHSIMEQTYQDFEIICVDDGSTDDTESVVQKLDRVRYVKMPVNQGISAARNVGMSLANGEYIAIMDSDDVALPGRLKAQVEFLDNNKSVVVCGTGIIKKIHYTAKDQIHPQQDGTIKALILAVNGSCMINSTSMMRADFLARTGIRYAPRETDEDHDLWCRIMIKGGEFYNLPELHLVYNRHDGNITAEKDHRWEAHQRSKTDIRVQFLLNAFTDFSMAECRSFARLMEYKAQCNVSEVAIGLDVAKRLQQRSSAQFGISMPYIHAMARQVEQKASTVIAQLLQP